MQLLVTPAGAVRSIYSEEIDLSTLGNLDVRRGSHVEPTGNGQWTADLSPVNGPMLGSFDRRSEALAAEVAWLEANWLRPSG